MIELLMYLIVFIIVGGVLYFFDEKYGVSLYTSWWKFTHKEPLSEESITGFICGRLTRERVFPALAVTALVCFLLSHLGEHDFVTLALKGFFLIFPGLLLGFALAGLIRKNPKFNPKVEAVLNAVDRVERGEVNVSEVIKDVASNVRDMGEKAVDAVTSVVQPPHAEPAKKDVLVKQVEETTKPPTKKFGEALSDFKKRS